MFKYVQNLQIDVVSGVSVCLLRAPHGVHVLVVICPVVVSAGGPVVAVREAVPIPAPEEKRNVIVIHEYKQFSSELLSPVSRAAPVPVPAPVAPVAGGGELVAGPGPHRLPRALPRGRPLHGRGSGPPAVIHQTLSRGPQI